MAASEVPVAAALSPEIADTAPLRIAAIETIPVRAPLAREFRGSYYRMTHRATLIVRLHTADGIVGEAYVGDEDATALEIEAVLRDEIRVRQLLLHVESETEFRSRPVLCKAH